MRSFLNLDEVAPEEAEARSASNAREFSVGSQRWAASDEMIRIRANKQWYKWERWVL